ncbi:hypothetical protein PAJ34TS1_30170 [Paenibacillus azoreducens]
MHRFCTMTAFQSKGTNSKASILISMVKTKLRLKVPQLIDALNGRVRNHHRQMIRMHYDHLKYLETHIQDLETLIDKLLSPYQKETDLLVTIPGIKKDAAASILAEISANMSNFPSEGHLASWGGLSPGNNESAGKKRSTRVKEINI